MIEIDLDKLLKDLDPEMYQEIMFQGFKQLEWEDLMGELINEFYHD